MKWRWIMLVGGFLLLGLLAAVPRFIQSLHYPSAPPNALQEVNPKCPVCGMFATRYAAWMGQIRFEDGHLVCFDGVKDLFKYYFAVPRYSPGRTAREIRSLEVTDYYSLKTIDGYQCRYVIGSDVLGPMGHELIPFANEQAAQEFLRDHHGDRVVTFHEITPEMIARLE